ncbi:MAG: TraM recognition domain-containing protein [Candidatus Pacebacteria bacterium]|nr:TraM recognition domain-containing protein [Candidatus Paceibacterota bacterium]
MSNPLIRNIIGQPKSTLDLRKVMDEKKILIINLSIGLLGEENSSLLGALIITQIQMAAMSRANIEFENRHPFYFYIDEFQNFSTESFAKTLSESRKYNLRLILAHQYIEQLSEGVRAAIFGNVANLISFRVGPKDAIFLSNEFYPISVNDFVNLPNFKFYIKMLINGEPKKPFLATALMPYPKSEINYVDDIVANTRKVYSVHKTVVDEDLKTFNNMIFSTVKERPTFQTEFWQAKCVECGKTVMVPFKPDDKRPVYCEKCFVKNKGRKLPEINNEIVKPQISKKPVFKKGVEEDSGVTQIIKKILK